MVINNHTVNEFEKEAELRVVCPQWLDGTQISRSERIRACQGVEEATRRVCQEEEEYVRRRSREKEQSNAAGGEEGNPERNQGVINMT